MISTMEKIKGKAERVLRCAGLILYWVVVEGLTYERAFEGSEEANHEAMLGRMFQAGERASAKALR